MKEKMVLAAVLALALNASAQVRNEIQIPDLKGYLTLKCDFHMHTVFSDGLVWPTVRVDEAYREGLDAIALTEHIEYRPHKKEMVAHHGRSFEIAEKSAEEKGILLIKGSEITRGMAPGHSNAIFLKDCNLLEQKEWKDAFGQARLQGAFMFWNHPGWDKQQPDTTRWFPEHTYLYDQGCMQGIEVANGKSYFPEAVDWCLEKGLTMIGTSDIHQPIQTDVDFARGEHRTMTLVFAKERTIPSIQEALLAGRTAVYFNEMVIGKEEYLKQLFENSIETIETKKTKQGVTYTLVNHSDLSFQLRKTEHDNRIVYFRDYVIQPHCRHTITVGLTNLAEGEVRFDVVNFLIGKGKSLKYAFKVASGGDDPKKLVE